MIDGSSPGEQFNPTIGGLVVAWQDNRSGRWDVYAKDLVTNIVTQITHNSSGSNSTIPNVSGRLVAYTTNSSSVCSVVVTNFDTLATTVLNTNTGCVGGQTVDISGTRVTYVTDPTLTGSPHLVVYDLLTGVETRATVSGNQQNPHISGDWVAYEEVSGTGAAAYQSIKLYNIPSKSTFVAVPGTSATNSAFLNDIDGTKVAYTGNASGVNHIYVYEFTATTANSYPTDCTHLNGAVAAYSATFTRTQGQSDDYTASFSAPAGPGLVCVASTQCDDGRVRVNGADLSLESEDDGRWHHHGDRSSPGQALVALTASGNTLSVDLDSESGCSVAVNVYAMNPIGSTRPGDDDCDDENDGDGRGHQGDAHFGGGKCHHHADAQAFPGSNSTNAPSTTSSGAYPGASGWNDRTLRSETSLGCSSGGRGIDAVAMLILLSAVAVFPRRARSAAAPSRR